MPYRLIYIGLGLVGVAAIALGLVFSTDGEPADLPESLDPEIVCLIGHATGRQQTPPDREDAAWRASRATPAACAVNAGNGMG